ncbi:MAG: sugar fermentation stimulation protein [Clostridia bacterium]|nr:sugar fermentation stimulation protein [Clostridia bacterium]
MDNKAGIKFPRLRQARLQKRLNRFLAKVELDGEIETAFIPNPGRLTELLYPGAGVYLRAVSPKNKRNTTYDLSLASCGNVLVSIDSRVPNLLVAEALVANCLPWFKDYKIVRSEPRLGRSRLDFHLTAAGLAECFVEVKSCTLVREGMASFPDAPTLRGSRHVEELLHLVSAGYRAAILFVVQREDAVSFTPNDSLDPLFGKSLRKAADGGVEVYAVKCRVNLEGINLSDWVPVIL